jgi:hypothetical protein
VTFSSKAVKTLRKNSGNPYEIRNGCLPDKNAHRYYTNRPAQRHYRLVYIVTALWQFCGPTNTLFWHRSTLLKRETRACVFVTNIKTQCHQTHVIIDVDMLFNAVPSSSFVRSWTMSVGNPILFLGQRHLFLAITIYSHETKTPRWSVSVEKMISSQVVKEFLFYGYQRLMTVLKKSQASWIQFTH